MYSRVPPNRKVWWRQRLLNWPKNLLTLYCIRFLAMLVTFPWHCIFFLFLKAIYAHTLFTSIHGSKFLKIPRESNPLKWEILRFVHVQRSREQADRVSTNFFAWGLDLAICENGAETRVIAYALARRSLNDRRNWIVDRHPPVITSTFGIRQNLFYVKISPAFYHPASYRFTSSVHKTGWLYIQS